MIRLRTWGKIGPSWKLMRLEMRWVPGLPQIVFLGARDPALRDVALRVKSALRSMGFRFPRGLKLLVDVSPRVERMTLNGLDLPVALGILWLTEQVKRSETRGREPCVWGDLSLDGEIKMPELRDRQIEELMKDVVDDVMAVFLEDLDEILGEGAFEEPTQEKPPHEPSTKLPFVVPHELARRWRHAATLIGATELRHSLQLCPQPTFYAPKSLRDLLSLERHRVNLPEIEAQQAARSLGEYPKDRERAEAWAGLSLNRRAARFVMAAAIGRFPALILGPDSLGLTSLLRLIYDLRSSAEWGDSANERYKRPLPLIAPSSPLTESALRGGTAARHAGVLERVRGGCFILQNWERWPEDVRMSLMACARDGGGDLSCSTSFEPRTHQVQILASGSLCACGQSDLSLSSACRCPSRLRALREQSWRSPVLDQFLMLGLPSGLCVTSDDSGAQRMAGETAWSLFGPQHDCTYSIAELRSLCGAGLQFRGHRAGVDRDVHPEAMILTRGRRFWAQEQVARALADLDQREDISEEHRQEARLWTVLSFAELGRRELPSPWATSATPDLTSGDEAPTL
jgi:hypothetical protein